MQLRRPNRSAPNPRTIQSPDTQKSKCKKYKWGGRRGERCENRLPVGGEFPRKGSFAPVKENCVEQMIFFGEESLRNGIREFFAHYHGERNHQGLENRRSRL